MRLSPRRGLCRSPAACRARGATTWVTDLPRTVGRRRHGRPCGMSPHPVWQGPWHDWRHDPAAVTGELGTCGLAPARRCAVRRAHEGEARRSHHALRVPARLWRQVATEPPGSKAAPYPGDGDPGLGDPGLGTGGPMTGPSSAPVSGEARTRPGNRLRHRRRGGRLRWSSASRSARRSPARWPVRRKPARQRTRRSPSPPARRRCRPSRGPPGEARSS